MKQETGKKSKKWIWLVVAAAVVLLAVTGVLLIHFLQPGEMQEPVDEAITSEIYWNLDRAEYTKNSDFGFSDRQPGEDGLFRIRFLAAGQLVEHITADRRLVNYIDTQSVMGLVFDADGMIVDVVDITSFAEKTAEDFYVKSVDGTTVKLNSSFAMNGMDMEITIPEGVSPLDARSDSAEPGKSLELEVMDKISVYSKEGVVSAVFMTERPPQAEVYIRLNQKYDSKTLKTTRTPDENGVYTIPFAYEGEQLELKCRDQELVNAIDAAAVSAEMLMGLLFDEEGYIIDTVNAAMALRGKLLCDVYNITEINGDSYTAERLLPGTEQGNSLTFRITEETDIFSADNGCVYEVAGQRVDQLEVMDRIACWTDVENNAKVIILYRRMVDSPLYFNKTPMYANGGTSRTPDASGYYVFEMAANGRSYTLKTKDKKIADKIDASSTQTMGLQVEGSIIKKYYDAGCVHGGSNVGANRYIGECMGTVVSIVNGGNFVIASDAKIYDVTGEYGVKYGSATTLQQYDRVTAFRNVQGEISYAFVTGRYHENTKLYWNLTRKYDATKKETTRTPDAEGYYVYEMLCDGKAVTVKTKNKVLASIIDEQQAPVVAMTVSGGIVKQAYPAIAGVTYGTKTYNYNNIDQIAEDGTVSCYYLLNGVKTAATAKYKVTDKTKIYNVSDNYINTRGERTTLKKDDRIQGIVNLQTEELEYVFVIERMIDSPFYWSAKRMYNTTTGETTREPNEEGYYTVELAVNGTRKTFKTKDKALMSAVDAQTGAFAMRTDGDIILRVIRASSIRGVPSSPVSYADVMKISSGKITTVRNRPGASDLGTTKELTLAKNCKIYNVSSYAENFGAATKLEIGDRIVGYADTAGVLQYIFIVRENTHAKGCISRCEHCGKDVWWEPFDGSVYEVDAHYYVPGDLTFVQKVVGNADETKPKYDIVLDLNGKTLTGTTRNFVVYAKLSIIDTVGGGVMQAPGAEGFGGNIMCTRGGTVNVYGGTIRQTEDAPASMSGGNIHASNSTVNIYGGTLSGGVATSGGSIYVMGTSTLTVTGGTIKDGSVEVVGTNDTGISVTYSGGKVESDTIVSSATRLALSGKPDVTGVIQLAPGAKLDISKLSADARVNVLASGVFTTERDDIDTYKNCLLPAVSTCSISVEGKALSASVKVPAVTDDLVFVEGTTKAVCPVCQAFVTWIPLSQAGYEETAYGELQQNNHVYLTEDIVYTGSDLAFITAPGQVTNTEAKVACVHLNGHNITTTNSRPFFGSAGILNVMGTGIVSGNYPANKAGGATVAINTNRIMGAINLYSGTYVAAEGNTGAVMSINNNGGRIRLLDDAKLICAEGQTAINCYAATLTHGEVTISGTIQGGVVNVREANPDKGFTNTLNIQGGNLDCGIFPAKTNIVNISGNPVITGHGLDLTSGAKVTLGEMTEGAAVTVRAEGVFSQTSDKAVDYLGYFNAAQGYTQVEVVEENLLSTGVDDSPVIPQIDNAPLSFAEGSTDAKCPVCQKVVTWTAIAETDTALTPASGSHYYLASDVTVNAGGNGKDGFLTVSLGNWQTGGAICLHLNEHNLTVTGNRTFMVAQGTLNVMGNGIVSGDFSAGSTVHVNGSKASGTANLFGGTFTKPATNLNGNIICIGGNGGTVNMYSGATVDGANIINTSSPTCVRMLGSSGGTHSGNAVFNMYGGTIKDGGSATGSGGNIKLDTAYAFFNMYDGTISGGKAETQYGGNIYAMGKVTLEGGTIEGGYAKMGGNIAMWETELTVKDTIISGGHSTSHGGNISLDLSTLYIQGQADIKEGHSDGQGGNIRAYKSTVIMEGGTISKGTCATAYNHNVWLVGDANVLSVLRMSGGKIYAQENTTKYATGIHAGTYAKVYLSGDATVVDHEGTTGAGVYIGATGKLCICDGWSGAATVRWASKYNAGQSVPVANAQVLTLDQELNETAGGAFTGTLRQYYENLLTLVPQADGTLKLSEEA